jgi:hypothetical protein
MPFLSYSPGPLSQMQDYAARQGTSPTCQPPTGSLSPPCLSRWCMNGGHAGGAPFVHERGAARTGGRTVTQGPPFYAPPHLCTNRGCAKSPLLPPLRGVGRYVPPPLAPNHTLTGKCAPPFLPRKGLRPAPVCAQTRFAPESHRGMALPFRHEQALCRKPPPRLRGAGR